MSKKPACHLTIQRIYYLASAFATPLSLAKPVTEVREHVTSKDNLTGVGILLLMETLAE